VQVLRLMEVFSAVYGPVFIAPSEKKAPPYHKRSGLQSFDKGAVITTE
jgi:hypothetical protein